MLQRNPVIDQWRCHRVQASDDPSRFTQSPLYPAGVAIRPSSYQPLYRLKELLRHSVEAGKIKDASVSLSQIAGRLSPSEREIGLTQRTKDARRDVLSPVGEANLGHRHSEPLRHCANNCSL